MSGTRANTQVRWLCHPAKWKSQGSAGWCRESNSSSACSQSFGVHLNLQTVPSFHINTETHTRSLHQEECLGTD